MHLRLILRVIVCMIIKCCADTANKNLHSTPNFVIMLMDDMGYGDLGITGEPNRETPNIDRMARQGMFFPEFYTGAAICSPSRASLLTGRLPIRNGFYSNNVAGHNAYTPQNIMGGISNKEILLPEMLKRANYTTSLIGKWHLGHRKQYLPLKHGFDTWFGSPNCHFGPYNDRNTPNIPVYSNNAMIGRYYDDIKIDRNSGESNYTKRLTAQAVKFIESRRNQTSPFFLLFTPDSTHAPHYASKDFLGKSRRGLYGDAVMELDHSVGLILDTIRDAGLHNTLVFFSSDNGAALVDKGYGGNNGRLMCGKQTTFEGGFRVPTIAWWPGHIKPGQVNHQVGTQMDLFTTISLLAAQNLPNDRIYDGIDLTASLQNSATIDRTVFFYRGNRLMAVRASKYKAHLWTFTTPAAELEKGVDHCPGRFVANVTTSKQTNHTDQPVIFDIVRDPTETYPLSIHSALYRQAMKLISAAVDSHQRHLVAGRASLDWCDRAVMNWAPRGCRRLHECLTAPRSSPFKCDWPH